MPTKINLKIIYLTLKENFGISILIFMINQSKSIYQIFININKNKIIK